MGYCTEFNQPSPGKSELENLQPGCLMGPAYSLRQFPTAESVVLVLHFVRNLKAELLSYPLTVIRSEHPEHYLRKHVLVRHRFPDRAPLHCAVQQPSTELDALVHHLATDPATLVPRIRAKIEELQRAVCAVLLEKVHTGFNL